MDNEPATTTTAAAETNKQICVSDYKFERECLLFYFLSQGKDETKNTYLLLLKLLLGLGQKMYFIYLL